jgi:nitroreductase
MSIHKIIKDRWSPVAFSERMVEESKIEKLFEAARWAPSSFNAQPWKFIVGKQGDENYSKLFQLIGERNRGWAKTAPLLVLVVAETIFEGRSTLNRFAAYDTGMAVSNLLAQATEEGLFVHQMGGYDHLQAIQVFDLKESDEAMAMMAIGYKGDPALLGEEYVLREKNPRLRKPIEDFVFRAK